MSKFQNDSIFWIEVEKVKPNPYQPRKEFSQDKLNYLAESIRQYGVLQPVVVTRHEITKEDGGLMSEYELIAGERRLRASKIAGLNQIPAIIRTEEEDSGVKLELAIIENLQREDLNPIDRAVAFQQLADEFGFKHNEIAKKVGKSREYVTNSLRLLALPEEIKQAIVSGQITEGHSRPILMLKDRPEEQLTLFKEIIHRRLTVRDAESIARKIAVDKVRKKEYMVDPEIIELESQLAESLGTRVQIEKKEVGGKVLIDFFSNDDLKKILELLHSNERKNPSEMLNNYINSNNMLEEIKTENKDETQVKEENLAEEAVEEGIEKVVEEEPVVIEETLVEKIEVETSPEAGVKKEETGGELKSESSNKINSEAMTQDKISDSVSIKENVIVNMGEDFIPKNSTENIQQEEINQKKEIPVDNLIKNITQQPPKKIEDIMEMDEEVEIIKSDEGFDNIDQSFNVSKENDNLVTPKKSGDFNVQNTSDNLSEVSQETNELDVDSIDTKELDRDIYSVKDFNI